MAVCTGVENVGNGVGDEKLAGLRGHVLAFGCGGAWREFRTGFPRFEPVIHGNRGCYPQFGGVRGVRSLTAPLDLGVYSGPLSQSWGLHEGKKLSPAGVRI